MKLSNYSNIYFLGIGGIGMSALARWFMAHSFKVYGYDRSETVLTNALQNEGATISYTDALGALPAGLTSENTLVVLTPAIPADSVLWGWFRSGDFTIVKRSVVLGMITDGYPLIGVAGTHGKTTTSSLTAHLLKASNANVLAFLGGVTQNYQNNYLPDDPTSKAWAVVEADEFDRSFLTLSPDVSIITNVEPDHLDIYHSEEAFTQAFVDYISKLEPNGTLIVHESVDVSIATHRPDLKILTYGVDKGDVQAQNLQFGPLHVEFDYVWGDIVLKRLILPLFGNHNVANSIAAITAVLVSGIRPDQIPGALASFKGIKRRFEKHVEHPSLVYVDDYAHHPTELAAVIQAVRAAYPDKRLNLIFQPHLFTRTRDFMQEFAQVMSTVDALYLMEIYPARELPIEGITSSRVLDLVTIKNKHLIGPLDIQQITSNAQGVWMTAGAGDIDKLVAPLVSLFTSQLTELS